MVNLARGGEEDADAGESHEGGRDAYQAGQRLLEDFHDFYHSLEDNCKHHGRQGII